MKMLSIKDLLPLKLPIILFLLLSIGACQSSQSNDDTSSVTDKPTPPTTSVKPIKGTYTHNDYSYPTLQIENLVWLAANLQTETSESWCYNATANCLKRGRLYRWAGAQEACKTLGDSWRLPTDDRAMFPP